MNSPIKVRNFKDLKVWQMAREISVLIYQTTQRFPNHETFGLAAQMRRSAISIPSNIAEGFNRLHNKEFRQFLFIALGSSAELETQMIISYDLKYCGGKTHLILAEKLDHTNRMIRNLIKKL